MNKPVVHIGYDGNYYCLLSVPKRHTSYVVFSSFDEVIRNFPLSMFDVKVRLIDKVLLIDEELLIEKKYYPNYKVITIDMVKDALKCLLSADFMVSRHFKLSEFFHSETAIRYEIENCPNTYKRLSCVLKNIKKLAEYLEIIRGANNGIPIIITSGFRSVPLNEKVGGIGSSRHCDGAAVDITCRDMVTLVDTLGWCDFPKKELDWYHNPKKNYIHIELNKYEKPEQTNYPRSYYES